MTVNAEQYDEKTNSYLLVGKSIDSYPKQTKPENVRTSILYLGMKITPIDENVSEKTQFSFIY